MDRYTPNTRTKSVPNVVDLGELRLSISVRIIEPIMIETM